MRNRAGNSICATAIGLALLFVGSGAQAATLQVDASGKLTGAKGVNVVGRFFDVEFVEGTCIQLFSGCDSASDFPFTLASDIRAASRALIDQVFLNTAEGEFDDAPTLTAGCTFSFVECRVATPAGFREGWVRVSYAYNVGSLSLPPHLDDIGDWEFLPSFDSSGDFLYQWARWEVSAVPEPSAALYCGIGLAMLASRRNFRTSP